MPAKPATIDIVEATVSAPATRKPLRRILTFLGLGIGAAAFAAAGFGAGWFLYSGAQSPVAEALRLIDRQPGIEMAAAPGAVRTPRPVPEQAAFTTTYHTFEEALTTNPAGSRRFLQLGVTLSTQYDAQVMANVDTHSAALRSDMLAVIGSFSEEDIAGRDGREALATALRDAINARLEALEGFGGIEGVFFQSFVLQ